MKSDKMPNIIYADIDMQIIQKILQQQKLTIWAFDNLENKYTLYRGEDRIKKFWTSLREHTKNIIEKKCDY